MQTQRMKPKGNYGTILLSFLDGERFVLHTLVWLSLEVSSWPNCSPKQKFSYLLHPNYVSQWLLKISESITAYDYKSRGKGKPTLLCVSSIWFPFLLILTHGPKVEFSEKHMLRHNRGPKSLLGSHPENGNRSKHDWEGHAIKLQGRAGKVSCVPKKKSGPKITNLKNPMMSGKWPDFLPLPCLIIR